MQSLIHILQRKVTTEHLFMLSVLFVNGGNYLYNLLLGRYLGPEKFADAAILITLLLVLSFVAMTFQLVTSKFSVLFEAETFNSFKLSMYKNAFFTGVVIGLLTIVFANQLQLFFKTSSSEMFVVFGIGVPIYFVMSINRGVYQGKNELIALSVTYQFEMISRLLLTVLFLSTLGLSSSTIIALGILGSFIFGLIPFKLKPIFSTHIKVLTKAQHKAVRSFFIITAFYELTQIIINNSDILMVKHYFEAYDAGLYASLALIGRVVYFIAWMFVMLLLPAVVQLKKDGQSTLPILLKYLSYISAIAFSIIIACYLFPNFIIMLLFGNAYISMSVLLWKYALATSLFALSNIFAYYYLSLDYYMPVVISGLFGLLQIVGIVVFHKTLEQVVHMQILVMFALLVVQLCFFFFKNYKTHGRSNENTT